MEIEKKFISSDFATARQALEKKYLYKYRSLSSDVQIERVKDIINNNRIRFSKPSELNDPIEGKPIFKLGDLGDSEYKEKFENWVWFTQTQLPNPPKYEQFIHLFRKLSIDEHKRKAQEINALNHAVIESKWRIFSLSSTPSNELLWAHYGDSHKGIALIFDASAGEFGVAMRVAYLKHRKLIDITCRDIYDILFATILTKREAWSYEEEYRCVSPEPWEPPFYPLDSQFMSFKPNQLVGVIFGARIDSSLKNKIMSWSKGRARSLKFWQADINEFGDIIQTNIKL